MPAVKTPKMNIIVPSTLLPSAQLRNPKKMDTKYITIITQPTDDIVLPNDNKVKKR